MKARFSSLWDALHSSFWFVPALMTAAAFGIAFLVIRLDHRLGDKAIRGFWWTYAGEAEGARAVLSTIAGSTMAVAGVVFSITIAALTLASSQFGPRLLRNFMRDTGNQIVLGTFIATFVYCLLVLRTVRGAEDARFVPHLAITVGVALALASLGVLIYFIHHVSASIQAPAVIAAVGGELDQAINHLFPQTIGSDVRNQPSAKGEGDLPRGFEREACPIASTDTGYLQAIDEDGLMGIATRADLLVRIDHRPGAWVVGGNRLVRIFPRGRVNEELARKINRAFVLGPQRTLTQDVAFPVHQLVEIAVRALSPGINDPFTAMQCVDRLGAALCRLAERTLPSPYRYDDAGILRVVAEPVTFGQLADAAFHPIRQYGRTSAPVLSRLLETITVIAAHVRREEDRAALQRHAALIERGSQDGLPEEADRKDVKERYKAAVQALSSAGE